MTKKLLNVRQRNAGIVQFGRSEVPETVKRVSRYSSLSAKRRNNFVPVIVGLACSIVNEHRFPIMGNLGKRFPENII